MRSKAGKLAQCGLEDLNLKPDHLLISFDPEQKLVLDSTGKPEVRLCNFELVRRRRKCQRKLAKKLHKMCGKWLYSISTVSIRKQLAHNNLKFYRPTLACACYICVTQLSQLAEYVL